MSRDDAGADVPGVATDATRRKRVLSDLSTPAFVLNRSAFARNCRVVTEAARASGATLRPHVKTHKTVEGAALQASSCSSSSSSSVEDNNVVTGFVASTIPEIELLLRASSTRGGPFRDVLYGVPASAATIPRLTALAAKHPDATLRVLVDHATQLRALEDHVDAAGPSVRFSAFVKVDTGYHRAGVPRDARGVDLAVAVATSVRVSLVGLYSHCGHAYDVDDRDETRRIAVEDLRAMGAFRDALAARVDLPDDFVLSVGSTPSCFALDRETVESVAFSRSSSDDDEDGERRRVAVVELHPGNYTLFDRQQRWTGACDADRYVAGRVLSRVIGHYEDRDTAMLDAGALALAKDGAPQGGGAAVGGRPDLECYRTSQEVTLLRRAQRGDDDGSPFPYDELPLGSLVTLLPNHSCLSAACFERYHVIDDETGAFSPDQEIVDEWVPAKYW